MFSFQSTSVRFFILIGLLGVVGSVPANFPKKSDFWLKAYGGRIKPIFDGDERSRNSTIAGIEEDVTFWHYLPGQAVGRQILINCADNCLSGFAKDVPLFIGVHGWGDGHLGGFANKIRQGFAESREQINIVLVDWGKLSPHPEYIIAVGNLKPVGEYIATLINYLVEQGVASLDDTHYAGHSLGGHIPNYITPVLNEGKMKSVIALDPASPLLDIRGVDGRLDPSDAQFVSVIHTSITFLGFKNPAGHVDFYPNSGKNQPGCDDNAFAECSHNIGHDFFKESIINPEAFSSCKCSSWEEFDEGRCDCEERVPMGWGTILNTSARGVFYLRTNPEPPYSQNSCRSEQDQRPATS